MKTRIQVFILSGFDEIIEISEGFDQTGFCDCVSIQVKLICIVIFI